MHHSWLLTIDALINLVLGVLLLVFPAGLVSALGVLPAQVAFYPSILGAVLVGIGIALVIERARGSSGLGLAGAISINMSAGLVLAAWLLIGSLDIPLRGQVLLWALVVILVGISSLELLAMARGGAARQADQPDSSKRRGVG
jgi:hypothetical protein